MNKIVQGQSGTVTNPRWNPGISLNVDIFIQIDEDSKFTLTQDDVDYVVEAAIEMLFDKMEEHE